MIFKKTTAQIDREKKESLGKTIDYCAVCFGSMYKREEKEQDYFFIESFDVSSSS